MNIQSDVKMQTSQSQLAKADPASPVLLIDAAGGIAVKSATTFNGRKFLSDTPVEMPAGGLIPGTDYAVLAGENLAVVLAHSLDDINDPLIIGGFHFAPGGNASARKGGDETPSINPCSLWDQNFRPACPDPRGMALIEGAHGHRFWCDIYLLGVDHTSDGTSRIGVTIADGSDCPKDSATGKKLKRFEYQHAVDVMTHHGKQLLSFEEFAHAAYGVTEKSAHKGDPETTKLDAARTSKFGIMQATGNMWVWGHDGDPDTPRASVFGGSWWNDDYAGSRYANVDLWAGHSNEYIGARGRSDHLQLG